MTRMCAVLSLRLLNPFEKISSNPHVGRVSCLYPTDENETNPCRRSLCSLRPTKIYEEMSEVATLALTYENETNACRVSCLYPTYEAALSEVALLAPTYEDLRRGGGGDGFE